MVSADRVEDRLSISSTNDGGRAGTVIDRCRTGPPNGRSIGEASSRLSPRPGDFHKQVANRLLQVTWAPDEGRRLVEIEMVLPEPTHRSLD
jgi:hypothetical protein